MRPILIAVVVFSNLVAIADTPSTSDELTTAVTLMARIGHCGSPSFSPDSKTLAFVCDLSGVPQVWTAAAAGAGRPW